MYNKNIDKRLILLGYSKDNINSMNEDLKTTLATGLVFNNDIIQSTDFYIPVGVANDISNISLIEENVTNDITIYSRIDFRYKNNVNMLRLRICILGSSSVLNTYNIKVSLGDGISITNCYRSAYGDENVNISYDNNNIYITGTNIDNLSSMDKNGNLVSYKEGSNNIIEIVIVFNKIKYVRIDANAIINHISSEENLNINNVQTGKSETIFYPLSEQLKTYFIHGDDSWFYPNT